jgi:hypothetical protein
LNVEAGTVTAPNDIADRRALEAFVVANADLDTLEALLAQFNIFDAIGVARQELRHSDFLAFLLDPRQSHGLGDAFLKRLLQAALIGAQDAAAPISVIDLDTWSLDHVTVAREWRNIDLLLTDEPHRLVVLIENKIGSAEHSDQLGRYLRDAQVAYPGWRILPLFLTPYGDAPSETAYLPVDYGLVCAIVEATAEGRRGAIDPAMHTLLAHYTRMLRREVVSDSEIAALCRRIYAKHQRALDLIFAHRPSIQDDLSRLLTALVEAEPDLVLDGATRGSVRFGHRAWETAAMKVGEGWTASGRIMLFEFGNRPQRLDLALYVGPGPGEIRQRLIETARRHGPPFAVAKQVTPKWTRMFRRPFLGPDDYAEPSLDVVGPRVREAWAAFLAMDLPAIVDAMRVEELTT